MQTEWLIELRRHIAQAKPKTYDPQAKPCRPLEHGWLLPYLLQADDFTWRRWDYWHKMMEARRVLDEPIPQVQWESSPIARKMLETSLNAITHYGGWQGWSSWSYFDYFTSWLLYAFGHAGHTSLPKEPMGAEGASNRLYQVFNIETLLAWPSDYFGDILAENQHGRRAGFFPTAMTIVEAMVRITFDGDARTKTVCDPCVGTGRMLLGASNYSLRLYGADIDPTVIKATLVNGYLYAPWLVKPLPFLDGANVDGRQTIQISNTLAAQKPEYYKWTVPAPNGHEFAPLKCRVKCRVRREAPASRSAKKSKTPKTQPAPK